MSYWVFHLDQNLRDVTERNISEEWERCYEKWRIHKNTPVEDGDLVLIWVTAKKDKSFIVKESGIYLAGRAFGPKVPMWLKSFKGDYQLRIHYLRWLKKPLLITNSRLQKILNTTTIYGKKNKEWGIININDQWGKISKIFNRQDLKAINSAESSFWVKFARKTELPKFAPEGIEVDKSPNDKYAMDIIYALELCDIDPNLAVVYLARTFIECHVLDKIKEIGGDLFYDGYYKQQLKRNVPAELYTNFNPPLSSKLETLVDKGLIDKKDKDELNYIVEAANWILHDNYNVEIQELKKILKIAMKVYNQFRLSGYKNLNLK